MSDNNYSFGTNYKTAFVTIVGRPNCGKSTLLNTIIGEELSIVSSLPQTTRKNFKGIYNEQGLQLIFIDTPGIHKGKYAFNESMITESVNAIKKDADIICYMVDLTRETGEEEEFVAKTVYESKLPYIIIFNKKDLCNDYEHIIQKYFNKFPFFSSAKYAVLSAIEPEAKKVFLDLIYPLIPLGHPFYSKEDITDANLRFFAAEYIRKQIINNTKQEVPHAAFVEVTDYKETPKNHLVFATIYVETEGQKGIIIGNAGSLIKKIQSLAEQDLSRLTGIPAKIKCHVKVEKNWRDNKNFLRRMGYSG